MEEPNQELMMKMQMFEQQMRQMQEQMQAIEQGMNDLMTLDLGLEELKGKTGKEIMAPIGRGIFAKAKLISEELIVDVGGQNLVKKSIDGTKEIINDQLKKLEQVREDVRGNMEQAGQEMQGMIMEAQGGGVEEGEEKGN